MASIARSYGCTAPAIRYIVNRGTARATEGEGASRAGSSASIPAMMTGPRPSRAAAPPERARFSSTDGDTVSSSPIDHTLRERVNSDIAAFLVAFDAAFATNSIDNRTALREATDRLLRAGARTRIALEQMSSEDDAMVHPAAMRQGVV